jgi:peptidoglycan-associated lipoprotein
MLQRPTHTRPAHALMALIAAATLAACSSPVPLQPKAEVPVESRTIGAGADANAAANAGNAGAAAQSQVASVDLSKNAAAATPVQRIVYFDYDSFAIKDDYKPVVEGNAKALSTNRGKRVAIEGHTDERGGREYNLALGQKRAEAVARALLLSGATAGQVEAVSFGKERPAVSGSDESAWAKNRRAELRDR